MHTRIYIEQRSNTSTEFWHYLPEVKFWLEPYEQQLLSNGTMISYKNEISEDLLTFKRTAVFNDFNDYILCITQCPVPEYQQLRMVYNAQNNISWSGEIENS